MVSLFFIFGTCCEKQMYTEDTLGKATEHYLVFNTAVSSNSCHTQFQRIFLGIKKGLGAVMKGGEIYQEKYCMYLPCDNKYCKCYI